MLRLQVLQRNFQPRGPLRFELEATAMVYGALHENKKKVANNEGNY